MSGWHGVAMYSLLRAGIGKAEWALYHLVRLDGYFADQLGLGMAVAADDVDQWPDDLLQPVDVAPWLQMHVVVACSCSGWKVDAVWEGLEGRKKGHY